MAAALASEKIEITTKPRFSTLQQWLAWQKQLHSRDVDLGLERVTTMLQRLGLQQPSYPVITVAGTNGKGSTVAFLQAVLQASGYRVGAYTSPHLMRYNERIQIAGAEVNDEPLCTAFAKVDAARSDINGNISLSFFEFGTLAALQLFHDAEVEVGILEVGLGGRLDAVNAVDADVAIVTTIGIDHVDWLGPDRESIGYEKAGIFRAGRPAICADPIPPMSLLNHAHALGSHLYQVGEAYGYELNAEAQTPVWRWWSKQQTYSNLPLPALQGQHQLTNAAAAIMALETDVLRERLSISRQALCTGLVTAQNPGRFQIIRQDCANGHIEWILDISHNPQGAQALAQNLRLHASSHCGNTYAIFGMLRDKDIQGVVQSLSECINHWYTIPLGGARGLSTEQLATQLVKAGVSSETITASHTAVQACQTVAQVAVAGDRVVVCGSFYAVANVLRTGVLEGMRDD